MKHVALTMHVEYLPKAQERKDCIDQRWYAFLNCCSISPILIGNSNCFSLNNKNFQTLSGIILTGGNSLASLDGKAPERDIFEKKVLDYAIKQKLPLLGVCRGMQVIQNYYGIKLKRIFGHTKQRHDLTFRQQQINVNSYHNYGTKLTCTKLDVLSKAQDGIIKAIRHKNLPLLGIMWHPERENIFSNFDIHLFRTHFNI